MTRAAMRRVRAGMRTRVLQTLAFAVFALTAEGAVSIANQTPLVFGAVVPSLAPGSVTITPAGARTSAGVAVVGASGYGAATFTVAIPTGNPHYTIVLPSSATLTGSNGATMRVDTFTSTPADTGTANPPARTDALSVGATLRVSASQRSGTYSGTFLVIVANQ